jgi:hypothetical protein
MPKVLTIAGVSILALGLVLGIALPSLAAPEVTPPSTDEFEGRIVKGKVLEVREADQEFDIQSGEEEVTISVDENTKYFKLSVPGRIVSLARHIMKSEHQNHISQPENVPLSEFKPPKLKWLRSFGEEAEFSDIVAGDRVVVWLAEDGNAERVLIIKPVTYASVSGTIEVSSDSKTITITSGDGEKVTLHYTDGTIFILKAIIQVKTGQSAHAIYDSDNMIAKRVVVNQ